MKLELAPLITSSSSKASELGLSSDAFYSAMTSPSLTRDNALLSYTATMQQTSKTFFSQI